MNKLVLNCFKAIAFAIIFVIIWDVFFYLWRVNALNQRMESIAVSMQQVVSKNNYLPEGDKEMFIALLKKVRDDMNNADDTGHCEPENVFITGIDINYNHESVNYRPTIDAAGKNIARYQLSAPASYGDVQVIELRVALRGTRWYKDASIDGAANQIQRSYSDIDISYTYAVPCLKYTTVTD